MYKFSNDQFYNVEILGYLGRFCSGFQPGNDGKWSRDDARISKSRCIKESSTPLRLQKRH